MLPLPGKRQYILLFFIVGICYLLGLFVPLMNGDASHHANIALHMYQHHNYVDLVDRGKDYLDKPHLLFWLAAASYHIFGVTPFAYKLPSLLFSIAGAWATYKAGKRLYNPETGKLAALILVSSQAFILACMDVRMDAILTACIILSSWQLLEVAIAKKWYNIIAAALFMALGFSTKGMAGIVIPCAALFFYLLYKRDFWQFFRIKWLVVALLTIVFMLPVLYCYYLQFDLHPEKEIRGMTGISGIQFILWGQNIERLEGDNWGGGKRDYFFYFHTLLWAFLPWSLLAYYAVGSRIKSLWTIKPAFLKNAEAFTIGTIAFVFILISVSRFQLPHYLNIIFPFLSVLIAAKLVELDDRGAYRHIQVIARLQISISMLMVILIAVLYIWFFPVHIVFVCIPALAALLLISRYAFGRQKPLSKIVAASVTGIALVNIVLNGFFYPQLLRYEGGSTLAGLSREKQIDPDDVYYYNTYNFVFDFETKHLAPALSLEEIINKSGKPYWLFTDTPGLDSLKQRKVTVTETIESEHFHISRLKPAFLNPATRSKTLDKLYLLRISP
ncbi:glycosyltransferase family 39 protein [Agriterribacter sp.]|uniref:glycosyltransferase family 39 protein n=1 Tax=Agriterribacter sp. TaxID=2821509 RepID=UPI002C09CE01|nr:glycosyltransferase family 39 protein [Agriterribacter sp.]HRP55455.1 glycosyltransferase family 39 protein [Agriterribacter sp.]